MTAAAGPHPPSVSPRGLLLLGWGGALIAGVIFFSLAWDVASYAPIVLVDAKVATWLHKHGTPEITAFMLAVTTMHSILGTSLLAIAFGVVLWRMNERYWLLTLALSLIGGLALNTVLKEVYARVRPYFDDPWVTLSTYSFPSGHTAGAVLLYGVLVAFLASRFYAVRQRVACVAGGVFAVVLVAFSRMYLGAHYLSDVVAAACSSAVWLVLCLSSVHELVRRRSGKPISTPVGLWKWIGFALVAAALMVAASYLPVTRWANGFELEVARMDRMTGLVVFTVVSIVASLLLLPVWIFQLAAGAIFGFGWGLLVSLVSTMSAAVIAFFAARRLFRGPLVKYMRGRPKFKAFERVVSDDGEGWKVVALMRLSPLLSSSLKSYFFGLSRIRATTYVWASLIGLLPGLLLRVYIGATGRSAWKGGPLEWGLLAAGIAATIAVSVIVRRLTKRRLKLG
jgi:uncharacterized membrane protein YdjX (TVP38/TMEM64 family)/membrane-associated phospholipid phosphatase